MTSDKFLVLSQPQFSHLGEIREEAGRQLSAQVQGSSERLDCRSPPSATYGGWKLQALEMLPQGWAEQSASCGKVTPFAGSRVGRWWCVCVGGGALSPREGLAMQGSQPPPAEKSPVLNRGLRKGLLGEKA